MSTRFTPGQDNRESFYTITSAAPCWNVAATRFTFILDCWTCARLIISLLVPARYGPEINKGERNERFAVYANHSGPAELSLRATNAISKPFAGATKVHTNDPGR